MLSALVDMQAMANRISSTMEARLRLHKLHSDIADARPLAPRFARLLNHLGLQAVTAHSLARLACTETVASSALPRSQGDEARMLELLFV